MEEQTKNSPSSLGRRLIIISGIVAVIVLGVLFGSLYFIEEIVEILGDPF